MYAFSSRADPGPSRSAPLHATRVPLGQHDAEKGDDAAADARHWVLPVTLAFIVVGLFLLRCRASLP